MGNTVQSGIIVHQQRYS